MGALWRQPFLEDIKPLRNVIPDGFAKCWPAMPSVEDRLLGEAPIFMCWLSSGRFIRRDAISFIAPPGLRPRAKRNGSESGSYPAIICRA